MLLGTGRKKMLNSSAAVPLYVQLKEKIEQKISDGEYKPGEKPQTEGEMAKSFGVSIITVRKAVSELVEKGLVEKKQGKGTFVCQRKVTKDMKKLQSFSEMCAHMGMKAGGRMLENRLEPASEKIARLLNVEKGSQVIYISRVRYADGMPMAIERNYFPLKYAFLLEERFDDNSLFTFLKEHSHTAVAISEKWIELCKATAAEAELLQMAKGTSMLFIKSVAYTAEKEPIYVGHQVFNGEKCSFYVCESTIGIE